MMEKKEFAYVRVSSREQNEGRQLEILKEYVTNQDNYFVDKMSGKNFDRPNYQALKKQLRAGDVLYFSSLDRMGRNYDEIKKEWHDLTVNKRVNIVVLDMPLLNMENCGNDKLTPKLIADLVIQILSYVAQREREMIHERQKEGIYLAKRQGTKSGEAFGRPKVLLPNNFNDYYQEIKMGNITAVKAMEMMGLKKNTFYKFKKEYELLLNSNLQKLDTQV